LTPHAGLGLGRPAWEKEPGGSSTLTPSLEYRFSLPVSFEKFY
jgi:hypothetical protein